MEGWALLERAEQFSDPGAKPRIKELRQVIEQMAEAEAKELQSLVENNANGDWVDAYLTFAAEFKFTESAKPVLAAYQKLNDKHQPKADELYAQSKKEFRAGKKDVAYAIYQEVVDKYYASTWYPKMKRWIEER